MWVILGVFAVGIFLLGGCTALWLIAKFLVAILEGRSPGSGKPSLQLTAQTTTFRLLHARIDADYAQGRISTTEHAAIRQYLFDARRQVLLNHTDGADIAAQTRCFELADLASRPELAIVGDAIEMFGGAVPAPGTPQRPIWFQRMLDAVPGFSRLAPVTVRLLQSIGIISVFLSVVIFVREQVWIGSTPLQQLILLLAFTLLCHGIGYTLCRQTTLRITGLAFLAAGLGAMAIDCQSVQSLLTSASMAPAEPYGVYATTTFLFTLIVACYCRWLGERFFHALAIAGAIATWGLTARSLVPLALLPVCYVPLILLARALVNFGRDKTNDSPQRWSVRWWLFSVWQMGSLSLSLGLPVLAFAAGRGEPRLYHYAYVAAILTTGLELVSQPSRFAWWPGVALLAVPAPLFAYLSRWSLDEYPLVIAFSGLVLACAGIGSRRGTSPLTPSTTGPKPALERWPIFCVIGALATVAAVALSTFLRAGGNTVAISTVLCAIAVGVTGTVLLRHGAYEWIVAFATLLGAVAVCDRLQLGSEYWPFLWTILGLIAHIGYYLRMPRDQRFPRKSYAVDGSVALAAAFLVRLSPALYNVDAIHHEAPGMLVLLGWAALVAYALLNSRWQNSARWRNLAWILLAPALTLTLYRYGISDAAVYVAVLAFGASTLDAVLARSRPGVDSTVSAHPWAPALLIAIYAVALTLFASPSAASGEVGLTLAMLGLSSLVVSVRSRSRQAGPVLLCEIVTLLLLSSAGYQWLLWITVFPLRFVLVIVGVPVLAEILRVGSSFIASRGELCATVRPFRKAGEYASLLLTMPYLLRFLPWFMKQDEPALALCMTWVPALSGLVIVGRRQSRCAGSESSKNDLDPVWAAAVVFMVLFGLASAVQCVQARFWTSACSPSLRGACAGLFGAVVLLSAGFAIAWRSALAPVTGLLGLLGLIGAGLSAFRLPIASLVFSCALLVWLGSRLRSWSLPRPNAITAPAFASVLRLLTSGLALADLGILLVALVGWEPGSSHGWAAAGASVLSVWIWREYCTRQQTVANEWSKVGAFGAGVGVALTVCHMTRYGGYADHLGPSVVASTLILLVLRQWVHATRKGDDALRSDVKAGLSIAATVLGIAGIGVAVWARMAGDLLSFGVTTLGVALLCWIFAVLLRRETAIGKGLWAGEAGGWVMLLFCASAFAEAHHLREPAFWILCAGVFLLIGLTGEWAIMPLCRRESDLNEISPLFMESRNYAALAVAGLGLLSALLKVGGTESISEESIRTVLVGTALLSMYASHSQWTRDAGINLQAQTVCRVAAYLVLMPLAWLFILSAYFLHSGYMGLMMLALAPVLLLSGYALRRTRLSVQRWIAVCSSQGISALVVVMLARHAADCPPSVCAITITAAVLQAVLAFYIGRIWNKRGLER